MWELIGKQPFSGWRQESVIKRVQWEVAREIRRNNKHTFATRTAMMLAAVRSTILTWSIPAQSVRICRRSNLEWQQWRSRTEFSASMTATMRRLQGGTRAAPHFRGVPCGGIAHQSRTGEHPRSRCQSWHGPQHMHAISQPNRAFVEIRYLEMKINLFITRDLGRILPL